MRVSAVPWVTAWHAVPQPLGKPISTCMAQECPCKRSSRRLDSHIHSNEYSSGLSACTTTSRRTTAAADALYYPVWMSPNPQPVQADHRCHHAWALA